MSHMPWKKLTLIMNPNWFPKCVISKQCQPPTSPRKTSLLKCRAMQSNSVTFNSKKSMPTYKFSCSQARRGRKAENYRALHGQWGLHKAWFIKNHWKCYEAQTAFLSPVTNCPLWAEQCLPCSDHLVCWFSNRNWEIRPGTMGTNGVFHFVTGLLWTPIQTRLLPGRLTYATVAMWPQWLVYCYLRKDEIQCLESIKHICLKILLGLVWWYLVWRLSQED
jgi:hypothetical protein